MHTNKSFLLDSYTALILDYELNNVYIRFISFFRHICSNILCISYAIENTSLQHEESLSNV